MTKSQLDITHKSQEISLFPAGDHKAAMNRRKSMTVFQGRRRLLESGTAIEHRWLHREPTVRGGEDERGRGRSPSRKGGLGDLPQENFEIQDD